MPSAFAYDTPGVVYDFMIKKNIYLMYAITFLQGMVFYGSISTLYRQVNGVSVFQITFIESVSIILCLALELPWGIVADKIGYKKVMAVNSVAFISIFAILILRIAFSIFQPLQSKLQNIQVESANRATTLSVFLIIMNSIGISTNLIFGAIAEIDIAFAFYCGIAFCLVGLILTSIWAKKTEYKFLL